MTLCLVPLPKNYTTAALVSRRDNDDEDDTGVIYNKGNCDRYENGHS